MNFPSIGSLMDLEKKLGARVSRYHVFSPRCGTDFDLGAFELADGRCFLISGTAMMTIIGKWTDTYWTAT